MAENKDELSDEVVRKMVVKDSVSRLQQELSRCQSVYSEKEIGEMTKYQLVGLVTLLRQMNHSTASCKNKVTDFNPKNATFFEDDNVTKDRSQSLSEVADSGVGSLDMPRFGISQLMSHSLASTRDDVVAKLELMQMQMKLDRDEKERNREERDRIRKEEMDERERVRKEDKEERDLKEKKDKEERDLKEKKDKEEKDLKKEERDLKEKKDKEERDLKREERDLKEKKDKEERDLKEKKEKEEKEEKEQRRFERELKDKAEQDLRKSELAAMLLQDKLDREERERIRLDRDIKDREDRAEDRLQDRKFYEMRLNDEKLDKLKHESRFDIRLKRAADAIRASASVMPDDVKGLITFFKNMEGLFNAYCVDEDLKVPVVTPFLNLRAKQLVLGLGVGLTFEQLKAAVFGEYNFTPRMYRAAFTNAFRSIGESATQFISRISNSLDLYLESRDVRKSYDRLCELLIADRFKDTLDDSTRHYVADQEHESWLGPKQVGKLVDLYQSERHPNWNYLRNPRNFGCKTGVSSKQFSGSTHPFVRTDRSRIVCTFCMKSGHVRASCFRLNNNNSRKAASFVPNKRKFVQASVRCCYVCNSNLHLARNCPNNVKKSTGKVFNAKRVMIESEKSCSDSILFNTKVLHFNDLLNAVGVKDNAEVVQFNDIHVKEDARVNSVTGTYGFIPSIKDNLRLTEGGGIALQDQVGGIEKFVGHLDLDVHQTVLHKGKGVVDNMNGVGDLCSGIEMGLQKKLDCSRVADTVSKTNDIHNSIYKHNKDHVVYVKFCDRVIPMLLDSGTQISVIKSELLREYDVSNNVIEHVKLLGAFGDPVQAKVISIEAKLQDDECIDLSNQVSTSLKIALCDKLNGDTGLLSLSDYNLLTGVDVFIPNVKLYSSSGRLCMASKKVDMADLVDNNITSNNDILNVINGGKFVSNNILHCDLTNESYKSFKEEQLNDSTLFFAWNSAANGGKEYFINDENALLYHKDQIGGVDIFQLVIPEAKRQVVIASSHDSNWSLHFGSIKTLQRIKAYFFWPSIVHDVKKFVSSCEKCQKRARITKLDRVPIKHVEHSHIPFEHVSIDLIGPLEPKSSSGHQYIICLIDSASRWVEALPLKGLTAKEACDALLLMFSRIGVPKVLVSDNGTNLVAGLNKELYTRLGVQMRNSTPLHPEGNSMVERWNQSLKKMLHHVVTSDRPREWHLTLPFLLWAYREIPNDTTGLSPFQLVYGRMIRGPLAILRDHWSSAKDIEPNPSNLSTAKYLDRLQNDLAQSLALADDNSKIAQDRYVSNYNKTAKHKEFEVGDLVLVLLPSSTNKLISEWMGPATVVGVVSDFSYRVALNTGAIRVLHANKLRKFVSRVNAVGVIYDEDHDFGDIECYSGINTSTGEQETIDAINSIDLSYLGVVRADQLRKLLLKHGCVFSNRPGTCNVAPHEINLVDGFKPKSMRPYRIPEVLKTEVDKQINQLLDDGKIKESSSCYAHPIVCVAKPNGDIRMCTDLRYVNSGTIRDAYPMPLGDDLLLKICPSKFISTLDCTAGYWQIPVKDSDTHKTAFVTHRGLYEWLALPFGAATASQTFQRVMDEALRPHSDYACAYVDDTACFSLGWDAHLHHLEQVFLAFENIGMSLKFSKCKFALPQVKFIGHMVGSGTRSPVQDKVLAIKALPEPHNKKLLRSFLGAMNFYRGYIPQFSQLALPLTELTKKSQPNKIVFNDQQRAAFLTLKDRLCNYAKLYSVDYSKCFHLFSDASDFAVGVALTQEKDEDGSFIPVSFASAKLTDTQVRWPTIDKEAYAILFGLRRFEHLVYGKEIVIKTDHNPLHYLTTSMAHSPRLIRWSLALAKFNIKIVHIEGKVNYIADYLSRSIA